MLDNRATSEAGEDIRRQLRRSLECLVGVHFTEGNAITVLRNGDEIFPAMLEAIRKAQHTVDLMTFVYWKGRPAQEFADALCDRAKAGLRVRVLIDALGGIQIEDGIVEAMEASGVDVHWYRKLLRNSPFKQNHRGHRKVCIIDETTRRRWTCSTTSSQRTSSAADSFAGAGESPVITAATPAAIRTFTAA